MYTHIIIYISCLWLMTIYRHVFRYCIYIRTFIQKIIVEYDPCTWLTVPDWSRKNRGSSSCCHVKKWHGMVEKPLHSWCKSMQTLCWQRSLQPLYFSYARTGKPWNFSCCSRTRMQPWKEPTKPNATVKRRREAGVYPFGREKTIWTHIWDFMVGSTWGFF